MCVFFFYVKATPETEKIWNYLIYFFNAWNSAMAWANSGWSQESRTLSPSPPGTKFCNDRGWLRFQLRSRSSNRVSFRKITWTIYCFFPDTIAGSWTEAMICYKIKQTFWYWSCCNKEWLSRLYHNDTPLNCSILILITLNVFLRLFLAFY